MICYVFLMTPWCVCQREICWRHITAVKTPSLLGTSGHVGSDQQKDTVGLDYSGSFISSVKVFETSYCPPHHPYGSWSPASSAGTGSRGSWWSCWAPCTWGQPAAWSGRPPGCLQRSQNITLLTFIFSVCPTLNIYFNPEWGGRRITNVTLSKCKYYKYKSISSIKRKVFIMLPYQTL